MTTYAVSAAGAVGGFYGAKLAQAGSDVHFLFRDDAEYVRTNGLDVRSVDGDFVLEDVSAHEEWSTLPEVDVVIVAVKSNANADVAPRIPAILRPGGAVLLIQNGLGSEPLFAQAIANQGEVIGGLAFINSERTARNQVTHMGNGGLTIAGYLPDYAAAGITDWMRAIAADFEGTSVPIQLDEDLVLSRWTKLLWNIPYNGLSVLLQASTADIMNDPKSTELVESIMAEVVAAAAADGRELPAGLPELMLEATRTMKPYATSMKVDFDNNRPLEVESIIGEPLRRGQGLGAPMPVIETLYRSLSFINSRITSS